MNPQGYRQLFVSLSRSLRPHVQIETVLAKGSLLAIAPLGVITTGVLDSLKTRATESVADFHALPRLYRLRFTPAVLLNRRGSIGYATIDVDVGMIVGQDALHLTAFDG